MLIINATLRLDSEISPSSISGTTNDWNPTGLSGAAVVRVTTGGAGVVLTGIAAQPADTVLIIVNPESTGTVQLAAENAGSSAANRFAGSTFNISVGHFAVIAYDGSASRWRLVGL